VRNPSWPLLTVFLVRIRGWAWLCAYQETVVAVKSIFRGFNLTAFESFVSIYEENPKVHLCNCSLYQQGAQRQCSRCASVTDASAQWMRQRCGVGSQSQKWDPRRRRFHCVGVWRTLALEKAKMGARMGCPAPAQ
jgi:hypothetical protein